MRRRRPRRPEGADDEQQTTQRRTLGDEPTERRALDAPPQAVTPDHGAPTQRQRVDSGAATQVHALERPDAPDLEDVCAAIAGGVGTMPEAETATQLTEIDVSPTVQRARTPRVFGVISIVLALPSLLILSCLPTANVWTLAYGGLHVEMRRDGAGRSTRVKINGEDLGPVVRRGLRRPRTRRAGTMTRRSRRRIDLDLKQLSPKGQAQLSRVHQLGQGMVISFLVFGLLLFFTGIGELRGRLWGRRLAMLWGTLGLLYLAALFFFVLPEYALACRDLCETILGNFRAAQRVCPPFGAPAHLASGGLLALYPFATLAYFNSSTARKAMG